MQEKGSNATPNTIYTPEGWLIKACKYLNVSHSDYDEMEKHFRAVYRGSREEDRDIDRDLAFGNYDRVQVLPVNSLAEFSNASNEAYKWYGLNQSTLLYHWQGQKHKGTFRSDSKGKLHIFDPDGQEADRANQFFAVSFCYFSDWMRNQGQGNRFHEILNLCEEQIWKLTAAFNQCLEKENMNKPADERLHGPVYAEVFGSLSSAELVILWSARQYTDIMYLIDTVRDFRYRLFDGVSEVKEGFFRTSYTMISFPDATRSAGISSWDEMMEKEVTEEKSRILSTILGEARILFATQDSGGASTVSEFSQFLNKCLDNVSKMLRESQDQKAPYPILQGCAGEYDLTATIQSRYLSRLFCNPLNWHKEDWTFPSASSLDTIPIEDCTCNGHNRVYNRYVLYSSTRLTYKPSDLPDFTAPQQCTDQGWTELHSNLTLYSDARQEQRDTLGVSNRSTMICEIGMPCHTTLANTPSSQNGKGEKEWGKFQRVISLVQERIPASSHLQAELQQLFSDYVQCCCSSADVLWVEDYVELFRQMLDHIGDSIQLIEVWKDYSEKNDAQMWASARDNVEGISALVRNFHQQTSHIITSNKLFFREQETHFGYTAQHDLVIHAYYDIIKYLIEFIYCYNTSQTQSVLCPLVNFDPGDMINSHIFTEESATTYLQMEQKLRNRIMVIHIPQDGLDNLLYYLPMLVHEVYHYSAPVDRRARNQLLANFAVYHTLRFGFYRLLLDAIQTTEDWKNRDISEFEEHSMSTTLFQIIDGPLFDLIEKQQDRIFEGIERLFFVSEIHGLWAKEIDPAELRTLQKGTILRSWFLLWLKTWLKEVYEDPSEPASGSEKPFSSLADTAFLEMVFTAVQSAIADYRNTVSPAQKAAEKVLDQSLSLLERQLKQALDATEDETSESTQHFAKYVVEYIQGEEFQRLMDQLDEIFPDVAMVKICNLSLESYMLQTALSLDKQFRYCRELPEDYVRFGAILHLLADDPAHSVLCRDAAAGNLQLPQSAQDAFCAMYQSAYELATSTSSFRDQTGKLYQDENRSMRAAQWCSCFNSMYCAYIEQDGFQSMSRSTEWISRLIHTQMIPMLDLGAQKDLEENRKQFFEVPYHQYLDILRNRKDGPDQRALFRLSLDTILRFQRYRTIRQMREEFVNKVESHTAPIVDASIALPSMDKGYAVTVQSVEHYYTLITEAVGKLYDFRNKAGLSTATGMWYRGVADASHPILPSGFVHFAEDAYHLNGGFNSRGRVYRYLEAQLHHYEAFRYSAEGSSPDVSPSQYKNTFNYLTLMQHYRQNTNLLDWSEDCFASTYFALEDEINVNDKYPYQRTPKKRDSDFKDRKADAALYILDPIRFNIACGEIEQNPDLFSVRPLTRSFITSQVPNLSVEENHCLYREYHSLYHNEANGNGMILLPSDGKPHQSVTLSDLRESHTHLNIHLPRAVYAAKLNSRIRAQSGLFVAFSLQSIPAVWNDTEIKTDGVDAGLFHYQALEEVQKYYLSLGADKKPFLMKIVIPRYLKDTLGKIFYDFGSSKERIYPELENHRNR